MEELTPNSAISMDSNDNPLFSSLSINSQDTPLLATPNLSQSYYRFPIANVSLLSQEQEVIQFNGQYSDPLLSNENYIALPHSDRLPYKENSMSPLLNGLRLLRTDSLIIGNEPSSTLMTESSVLTNYEALDESEETSNIAHKKMSFIALKTWGVLVSLNSPLKLMLLDDLEEYIIGRKNKCHFRLLEAHISGLHFSIERKFDNENENTYFVLKDLGSKNGTYLNGKRVDNNKDYQIRTGDIIHILARGKDTTYLRTSFMFLNKDDQLIESENSFDSYEVSEEGVTKEDNGYKLRLAVNKYNLRKYVLKTIDGDDEKEESLNKGLIEEYDFYNEFGHKNIISRPILISENAKYGVLFQQGNYGNLGQYLKRNITLEEYDIKKIAISILNAIEYLNLKGIQLKYLKLSMLSVFSTEPFHLVLSDFYQAKGNEDTLVEDFITILLQCFDGLETTYDKDADLSHLNKDFIEFIEVCRKVKMFEEATKLKEHKWLTLNISDTTCKRNNDLMSPSNGPPKAKRSKN
ncbi:hypothetical protein K502DRAFT_343247 [Neoconidiobolus thromboides FSU 785]|nr:hypothetical protein K502DRAFT_343247 [Neoconidiobolus thromboides FSU 785]